MNKKHLGYALILVSLLLVIPTMTMSIGTLIENYRGYNIYQTSSYYYIDIPIAPNTCDRLRRSTLVGIKVTLDRYLLSQELKLQAEAERQEYQEETKIEDVSVIIMVSEPTIPQEPEQIIYEALPTQNLQPTANTLNTPYTQSFNLRVGFSFISVGMFIVGLYLAVKGKKES